MLLVTQLMYSVKNRLEDLKKDAKLMDYKLSLELNLSVVVYIRVNEEQEVFDFKTEFTPEQNSVLVITPITDEKAEYIDFTEKIDMHKRRRLGGLIEPKNVADNLCPVFCFYSYKGGVGRTTTLAAFATYLAKVEQKKVVIIDCDFEAPGITNYFDLDLNSDLEEAENNDTLPTYKTPYKSGIVEYFLDQIVLKKQTKAIDLVTDYLYEVGSEYTSGAGSIHLLAAGNLDYRSDETGASHREQYLEALARIDTYGTYGANAFKTLFADLAKAIDFDNENGVILIDSRTGFNDTFATISSVSDAVVGFFGNNMQTQAGLHQFLEMFGKQSEHNKTIILANSIIASKKHCENIFKPNIKNFIDQYPEKFENEATGFFPFYDYAFPVVRENETLANIGIKELEAKEAVDKKNPNRTVNKDFIDLVTKENHYNGLFRDNNGLIATLKNIINSKKKPDDENEIIEDATVENLSIQSTDITVFLSEIKHKVSRSTARMQLLQNLHNDKMLFPVGTDYPYAEDMTEVMPENFFFRNCMRDIFNPDKFIIAGYKGMGKTQLYQGLKHTVITNILAERAGKKTTNYEFINVLPVYGITKTNNYFDVNAAFAFSTIKDPEWFFSRFWVLLTFIEIQKNVWVVEHCPTNIILPEIRTDNAANIKTFIHDDAQIQTIFDALRNINELLKKENKHLIIAYDQLDYIVKPQYWSIGIAPLVSYWRNRPHSNMLPKILVRTDLYDRMTNLTNKEQLSTSVTDLTWKKEEVFAFIFKIIFVHSKFDFYKLIYAYNDYTNTAQETIIAINNLLDNTQQLKNEDETIIKFLIHNFFGDSPSISDSKAQAGTTYDWFFNSLSDAKGILSIRPLLDLLKKAIQRAEEPHYSNNEYRNKHQPVLSGLYFSANTVRQNAVEQHYTDLAQDTENTALLVIKDYYKTKCPLRLKTYTITNFNLRKVLNGVLTDYKNDERLNIDTTVESLISLLVQNGIIKAQKVTADESKTRYEFPYLYRLFLGLTSYEKAAKQDYKNRAARINQELKK
jgi:MinD-like ATPase involved in chromosome partitioning or flagellar assembly